MTDTKAVMQQALDALESVLDDDKDVLKASISGGLYEVIDCQRSIASLRAAIAHPKPPAHDAWKNAMLDKLALTCMDAHQDQTPESILNAIIAWHVQIASDHCIAQPKDKP